MAWDAMEPWVRAALAGSVAVAAFAAACDAPAPPLAASSPTPPVPTPSAAIRCSLPAQGPYHHPCPRELPHFAHDVNEAIAKAQNERPELFDFARSLGGLAYGVRDYDNYHAEVLRNLEEKGFCAVFSGGEVAIKNTNDFSEQYRVYASEGYVRWGGGAYRATCRPAWF